ncbi:MauE/DoxX family redox-associated membrane protein [Flavobacterium sp. ARAG 55.4]|uniref:MauE/DoxX family redox-associated membrane protein n=1 Tax=Flavobacterium sp. ARAG 55.4 TaxID=3451357 RepID=UPI003F48728E
MKIGVKNRTRIITIIVLLYILLFSYAAISKILDFENFQVQLGQSPLLSAFAFEISYLVPFAEIVIVLILLKTSWRYLGLLGSLILMTLFSSYIFIVLHYTSFVPCSCGGILEKMSWNSHLLFNLFFVLLAIVSIVFYHSLNPTATTRLLQKRTVSIIVISLVSSVTFMIALFLYSEAIMQYHNPFIRRYPQHPVSFQSSIDLKYNSYYFAGFAKDRIYLGNYSNPLQLLSVDPLLKNRKSISISNAPKKLLFKSVKILLQPPYFYLVDGVVGRMYKGNMSNWVITTELRDSPYFTKAVSMANGAFVIRSNIGQDGAHTLGIFETSQRANLRYDQTLLQQQIDGVFDTDGTLLYNASWNRWVYLYYYRNAFLVGKDNLELDYRGHTIDTTTQAKIKIAYLKDQQQRKMAAPPLIVNAHAALEQHLLFVHSLVKGQLENDKLWQEASIIDLYNLENKSYRFSFALYRLPGKKLTAFFIANEHLYALFGTHLAVYNWNTLLKKELKKGTKYKE